MGFIEIILSKDIILNSADIFTDNSGVTYSYTGEQDASLNYRYTSETSIGTIIVAEQFSGGTSNISNNVVLGVQLPPDITSIGNNAFSNNSQLTNVFIPNGVTYIGDNAFASCSNLHSMIIPSSVITLGIAVFSNCSQLVSCTNNSKCKTISQNFFLSCNNLLNVNIPDGVTSIGSQAFYSTGIQTIVIPDSCTTIESYAFASCIQLTNITIPSSVTTIGNDAFAYNPNVTNPTPPYLATLYTNSASGEFVYDFFMPPGTNNYYVNVNTNLCFKEGSKILHYNRETNQEEYIDVEKLKKGDLVKTLLHEYKKIEHIGNSKMYNNVNNIRSVDKLYKCSKTEYPELFEDLIITGAHSILVNDFKDKEKEKTLELLSDIYITDNKYRLPACIDKRSQIYEVEGIHTIWHFSLEHENYYMNYGVFANGLLVETASNRMMVECSGLNIV